MSQKSVKKGKKKSSLNSNASGSAAVTQIVCFVIVVSVAVLGFFQTRRAVFQLRGQSFTFLQSEKYSEGDAADVSEIPADNDDSSAAPSTTSTAAATTPKKTSRSAKTTKTSKTTKTTRKKTTTKKTTTTTTTRKEAPSGTMVKITVSPVNIRSGAGTEFEVIGRTSRGKVYRLISKDKDAGGRLWYHVSMDDGKTGWIMASCASETDNAEETTATTATTSGKTAQTTKASTTAQTSKTAKAANTSKSDRDGRSVEITVSPVNIRSGAGREFSVIGRTSRGKVFPLLSTKTGSDNKKWCEVELKEGKTGWVMASCCKEKDDSDTGKTTKSKTSSASQKKDASASTSKTTKTTTATAITTATKTATSTEEEKDKLLMKIQPEDKSAKYFIVVYIGSQSTVVYKKDKNGDYTKQVKVFTCSTGKKSSPTRTGKYHIRAKYRWRWLVGNVYGQYNSSISDSYLFHSVPYYQRDYSTLENEEYDKLGKPASKGCIRMCVRDCKWIYDHCAIGTQVRIVSDSGPAGPGVPKRKTGSRYSGWDPSDKWAQGNPYFE